MSGVGYLALGLVTIHISNHAFKDGDTWVGFLAFLTGLAEMVLGGFSILGEVL